MKNRRAHRAAEEQNVSVLHEQSCKQVHGFTLFLLFNLYSSKKKGRH